MKKIIVMGMIFIAIALMGFVTSASDTYTIKWVVKDFDSPTFNNCRNFTQPANQSFSQSITASDNVGIGSYVLNDTDNFLVNSVNGFIRNNTLLDTIEIYNLELTVNDTSGNEAYCYFYINITAATTPTPTVTVSVQQCKYKKLAYYNPNLVWQREQNCI